MSSEHDRVGFEPDDVQALENVLEDTDTSTRTRRWLVGRAALGVGVAAASVPVAGVLAKGSGADTPMKVGVTAVTAEALAVTYLTNLIEKAGSGLGKGLAPIKAANAAEEAHYQFLSGAGFKPLTTRFWIPDAALEAKNAAATIETFETLFVNAYLIGATVFAKAKSAQLARYAAEIAGVEAEHRALARDLQGKLPDNLGFEQYKVHTLAAAVQAIEATGVGLGKKGSGSPGNFYTYSGTTSATTLSLSNTAPDQAVMFPSIGAAPATGQPAMTG